MKKVIAIGFALFIVLSLSTSAFAGNYGCPIHFCYDPR